MLLTLPKSMLTVAQITHCPEHFAGDVTSPAMTFSDPKTPLQREKI